MSRTVVIHAGCHVLITHSFIKKKFKKKPKVVYLVFPSFFFLFNKFIMFLPTAMYLYIYTYENQLLMITISSLRVYRFPE